MSKVEFATLSGRASGKWQIPLLFLSLAGLVGVLLRLHPAAPQPTFHQRSEQLTALVAAGMYAAAVTEGEALLEAPAAEGADADRAAVRQSLARALVGQAEANRWRSPPIAHRVLDTYQEAEDHGARHTVLDYRNLGVVSEWLDQFASAVGYYEKAIAAGGEWELALRRRVIELKAEKLTASPQELGQLLDEVLLRADANLPLLHWAAGRQVDLLTSRSRFADATALVDGLALRFAGTELAGGIDYLQALILYRGEDFDAAEQALRDLRNRLALRDELYARTGWLLGRVILFDESAQRPVEALSFFRDVVALDHHGPYQAASYVGIGEALAYLERFEESLEAYREALRRLEDLEGNPDFSAGALRTSLTVVADGLRRKDRPGLALDFLVLAAALVDRDDVELVSVYLQRQADLQAMMGRALRDQADSPTDPSLSEARREMLRHQSRERFIAGAQTLLELARVTTLNEPQSAAAAWQAASLYGEAGDASAEVEVLGRFVREHADGDLVRRAFLRLGRAREAIRDYRGAIDAYQEGLRRFPRSPYVGASVLRLASCFMQLGPQHADEAEKALQTVLEDSPLFTPQAPEYADALFMLGELLSRSSRHEEAITVFEEIIARYPEDGRRLRADFMLADAYRRSGLALQTLLAADDFAGDREWVRAQARQRLNRGAETFGELLARHQGVEVEALDDVSRLLLRHARLYEADCLFDLQRYRDALPLYERAAWIHKDRSSALAAYVQIINCHMFLGQADEARTALRRAQFLAKGIPDDGIGAPSTPETRREWQEYFDWLERSDLF